MKNLRRLSKVILCYSPFIVRPEQVVVDITDRCNYRCPTCSKWLEQVAEGELTQDQWKDILRQIVIMPYARRIVFAGGEPLLRNDIVDLIRYTTMLDLKSVIITNGSLLSEEKLKQLQDAGLCYLMISLNALHQDIHDQTRGVSGSFNNILDILEIYSSLKENMKLGIATIITKTNLNDIIKLTDYIEEKKLHGIIFQTLVDSFHHKPSIWGTSLPHKVDKYIENPYTLKDKNKFAEVFDELILRQRRGANILNAPVQLKAMKSFYTNPAKYYVSRCTAGISSCLIDAYGNVRMCNMYESIGNVCAQRPLSIWKSSEAVNLRKKISKCHSGCRVLNHIY